MTATITDMSAAAQHTAEPRQTYTSVRITKDLIARIKVQVEKGLHPSIYMAYGSGRGRKE